MSSKRAEVVRGAFEAALRKHGFGFQYAAISRAVNLANTQHLSQWEVLAAELPVVTQGVPTHIDFVLQNVVQRNLFLVVECKRVHSSVAAWCFARTPFISRHRPHPLERLVFDEMRRVSERSCHAFGAFHVPSDEIYGIGIPVKVGEKDESGGQPRKDFEGAVSQVFRGVNGLMNWLGQRPELFEESAGVERDRAYVAGAIFTTAEIWATDAPLDQSDLSTGNITLSGYDMNEKPWLWYHHHVSPGIKHDLLQGDPTKRVAGDIASALIDALEQISTRTVAIVSAAGLDDFLQRFRF